MESIDHPDELGAEVLKRGRQADESVLLPYLRAETDLPRAVAICATSGSWYVLKSLRLLEDADRAADIAIGLYTRHQAPLTPQSGWLSVITAHRLRAYLEGKDLSHPDLMILLYPATLGRFKEARQLFLDYERRSGGFPGDALLWEMTDEARSDLIAGLLEVGYTADEIVYQVTRIDFEPHHSRSLTYERLNKTLDHLYRVAHPALDAAIARSEDQLAAVGARPGVIQRFKTRARLRESPCQPTISAP